MKIATQIKAIQFNSGVCEVFRIDDSGRERMLCKAVRFGNRVVGINRHYAARQAQIEIDRVLHIHKNINITTHDMVRIDKVTYSIEQVQHIDDAKPPVSVITLRQLEMHEGVNT